MNYSPISARITGICHETVTQASQKLCLRAQDTHIVCTTTAAKEPIIDLNQIGAGVHINAVGACTSNARELSSNLIAGSKLYTDRIESLVNESGAYIKAKDEGLIDENHIVGEIGDVILGKAPSRTNDTDITVFKSLGLAVEDIAACMFVYDEAVKQEIGLDVEI